MTIDVHDQGTSQGGRRGGHRGKPKNGMSRRSLLLLAGAGGLVAAGGGAFFATRGGGDDDVPAADLSVTRPPGVAARPALWSQTFQPGHGWTAGGQGTASSNPNDTSVHSLGSQSFTATTAGNGVESFVRIQSMPPVDLTGRTIRLVFRVDDTTHLDNIVFYVGTQGFSDYYYWKVHTHSASDANYVGPGEWVTVNLQWADVAGASGRWTLSPSGVPSVKSGFTDMSFGVYDDKKGQVRYHLQAVELIKDTASAFPRGVVSITFDDSFASVYDLARPIMSEHKYRGTIYNISQAAGTDRYLSVKQMQALQDTWDWEMAGHAYSMDAHNAGYDQLTAKDVDKDLRKLRGWMASRGFRSENFAYPHGIFGATKDGIPIDRIAKEYFATARSIISETAESFPPAMPYRLKAVTGVTDDNLGDGDPVSVLTDVGGMLDRCAGNGDWLVLCFHQLATGKLEASTQISQKAFATVVEEIARRDIEVATVGEVLAHS